MTKGADLGTVTSKTSNEKFWDFRRSDSTNQDEYFHVGLAISSYYNNEFISRFLAKYPEVTQDKEFMKDFNRKDYVSEYAPLTTSKKFKAVVKKLEAMVKEFQATLDEKRVEARKGI